MDEPVNEPAKSPPSALTDSPWFWSGLFSLMALVGLALIAPKFAKRQGQIERRFLGREQAALERQRRLQGLQATDLADTATEPQPLGAAPGAGQGGTIVPLWTLAVGAGLAAAGSAVMLARERRRGGNPADGNPADGRAAAVTMVHPMIERRRAR